MKQTRRLGKRFCVGLLTLLMLLSVLPAVSFASAEDTYVVGETLFSDDFSGDASQWSPMVGTWAVTDGAYHVTNTGSGAKTYAGDTSWTDYEVEVTVSDYDVGGNIMICGRVQDDKNRVTLTMLDNKIYVEYRVNGATSNSTKVDLVRPTEPFTLTYRCVGTVLQAYFNGELVLETTNTNFANGKIGLATYNCNATFDNVVVRKVTKQVETMTLNPVSEDYQVFQRNANGEAVIPVSGSLPAGVASVWARPVDFTTKTAIDGIDWVSLSVDGITFGGNVTVPQGGWYAMQVESRDAAGVALNTYVTNRRFGVGILILCIGQSNMVGQGKDKANATVANDLVANFKNDKWGHLVDPYDAACPGTSLVPDMANVIVEKLGIPVGIIPAADSGAGLCKSNSVMNQATNYRWGYRDASNPFNTGTLYGRALSRVDAAGGDVELAIWNQGETDGMEQVPAAEYKAALKQLQADFIADLGLDALPFFLVQMGSHDRNLDKFQDDFYSGIRNAMVELDDEDNEGKFFMAASEIDLKRQDTAHYPTDDLKLVGRRVGNSVLYYYGQSTYYRGPSITGAALVDGDGTKVNVTVAHNGGTDIAAPTSGSYEGFSVTSGGQPVAITGAVRLDATTVQLTLEKAVTACTLQYYYGVNPTEYVINDPAPDLVHDNSPLALPLEPTTAPIEIGDDVVVEPVDPMDNAFEGSHGDRIFSMTYLMDNGYVSHDCNVTPGTSIYATKPADAENTSYYVFAPKSGNAALDITLPITKAGTYEVVLEGYGRYTGRATYQVSIDGVNVGEPFQHVYEGANTGDGDKANRVMFHSLGDIAVDGQEFITLHIAATEAGAVSFTNVILRQVPYVAENGDLIVSVPCLAGNGKVTMSSGVAVTEDRDTAHATYPTVAYRAFSGLAVGSYIDFAFKAPAGMYLLTVEGYGHSNRATYQTLWNGQEVGSPISQKTTNLDSAGDDARRLLTNEVGMVAVDESGAVTLRVQATTAGTLAFCNFILTPYDPYDEEGNISYSVHDLNTQSNVTVQKLNDTGVATHPYRDVVGAAKVGDYVTYTIPAVPAGSYIVKAWYYGHDKERGNVTFSSSKEVWSVGEVSQLISTNNNNIRLAEYGIVDVPALQDVDVTFTVSSPNFMNNKDQYKAVFCDIVLVPTTKVPVNFVGKQNNVLKATAAYSGAHMDALLSFTPPTMGGYTFRGWDASIGDGAMLYDAAVDSDSPVIYVTGSYLVDESKTYELTATDATVVAGGEAADSGVTLNFDTRVEATAEGEVAYWLLDGAKVGWGKSTYVFYVSGQNDIRPVYAADAETELTPEILLQQTLWTKDGDRYNLSVVAQTSIPTDVELGDLSYGVYYTATEDQILDLANATKYIRVTSSKTGSEEQFICHLLSVAPTRTRYARAYMVLNGTTYYSSEYVRFDTAADGVTEARLSVE